MVYMDGDDDFNAYCEELSQSQAATPEKGAAFM
jgi:hypothetical protein